MLDVCCGFEGRLSAGLLSSFLQIASNKSSCIHALVLSTVALCACLWYMQHPRACMNGWCLL